MSDKNNLILIQEKIFLNYRCRMIRKYLKKSLDNKHIDRFFRKYKQFSRESSEKVEMRFVMTIPQLHLTNSLLLST